MEATILTGVSGILRCLFILIIIWAVKATVYKITGKR